MGPYNQTVVYQLRAYRGIAHGCCRPHANPWLVCLVLLLALALTFAFKLGQTLFTFVLQISGSSVGYVMAIIALEVRPIHTLNALSLNLLGVGFQRCWRV